MTETSCTPPLPLQPDHRSFNILEHFEQVQTIGAVATKEYSMLKAMEKMEHEWQGLEFKVMAYKDTGEN